ncbi:MAG: hypothetical protein H6558_16405 [Lewinellaceae bacterium]|nr:hypothetical protein [Lewinellaceae bacterium]
MPKTKTLLLLALAALSIYTADAQCTGQEMGQPQEWCNLTGPTNEMVAEKALARLDEFAPFPPGKLKPISSETYWLYLKENPFSQEVERYLLLGILIPFFLNGLILFFLRGKMYYLYWALYVLFNLFSGCFHLKNTLTWICSFPMSHTLR